MKNKSNALYAAHVKLGRPNSTAYVVKSRSETVWSALANDTPRGCGTVEVTVDTPLAWRGGVITPWQRV